MDHTIACSQVRQALSFMAAQTLLAALSLLLLLGCSDGRSAVEETAIPVELYRLDTDTVLLPEYHVASIQAQQFIEVRSRIHGFIASIAVDEGTTVQAGQLLFTISSRELSEELNSARARLAQVQADAAAAEIEMKRLAPLVEQKIIAPSAYTLAKARYDAALSSIQEAEALVNHAEVSLSYTQVRAPFAGLVDRIPLKRGAMVSQGDLLTHLTDIEEVFAYYKLNEKAYLDFMQSGGGMEGKTSGEQLISLRLADGSLYPHSGTVEIMEADFDPLTGSIAIRARFPNPDRLLKHGSSGTIVTEKAITDVFLIPQEATFDIQDFSYVYLLQPDNRVIARSFQPLARLENHYVVRGFQPGDQIVYAGLQFLKDGMRIQEKRKVSSTD
ncbi:MAG: efflux RND transporter periplasmic adaptor subunit [Nitritalea sp.]